MFDVRDASMSGTSTASCLGWLEPLAGAFGARTWRRALVLVAGALLAQGPRTVASALRAAGPGAAPGFGSYHRVLSRRRWSGRAISRLLLADLLRAFDPPGPPVVPVKLVEFAGGREATTAQAALGGSCGVLLADVGARTSAMASTPM